eukprot:1861554-Amphidinium_carterae.1
MGGQRYLRASQCLLFATVKWFCAHARCRPAGFGIHATLRIPCEFDSLVSCEEGSCLRVCVCRLPKLAWRRRAQQEDN